MPPDKVKITEFFDHIRQRPSEYKDCSVITVTHVKDMNNKVLHEYLHVVIWNPHTTSWRRLIAERNDIQDQVCIGEYPWIKSSTSTPPRIKKGSGSEAPAKGDTFEGSLLANTVNLASFSNSSSPGGGDRLPLPMRYVELGESSVSLEDMAEVLLKVHKSQPKYSWYCYNCFWYCEAVFIIMRRGRHWEKLKWARVQGTPWIGIFARKAPIDEAGRYKDKVLRAVPISANPRASGHNMQVAEKDDADTESQFKTDYHQAEAFVAELQLEDPKFWDDLDQKIDVSETREAYKKLKEELMSFSQAVLADPHKDENLEAYKSIQVKNDQGEGDTPSDPLERKIRDSLDKIAGPEAMTDEEKAYYEEALRAFVGSVIKDLPKREAEA